MHLGYGPLRSVFFFCRDKMFWTTAVLWKIIKVLRYLSEMIRYFLARKKELFFCSILDRFTRLSPHLLQQHGKIRHESEGASVFDGAFRHRGDAQRLYPSWFGGCGGWTEQAKRMCPCHTENVPGNLIWKKHIGALLQQSVLGCEGKRIAIKWQKDII